MHEAVRLEDGLMRLRAPNHSPMTHTGTNTYILGEDRLAVIDPGPAMPEHLEAILGVIRGRPVSHIFVTHSHLDHSPLARPLAEHTGAPVLAFGDSSAGRSVVMVRLADAGLAGGGEGVDQTFHPDRSVSDGDIVTGDGWEMQVLHTPGHMGNHISLMWHDVIFSGDLVMGWASSLVSPPDGDLTDFLASCARLRRLSARILHSGHGDPIPDPEARLTWLIDHRNARSRQILKALESGPATPGDLTPKVYSDVPAAMHPAALRNLFAHLIHLSRLGSVQTDGPLSHTATFRLNGDPDTLAI